jgi:hypothetical protein
MTEGNVRSSMQAGNRDFCTGLPKRVAPQDGVELLTLELTSQECVP